MFIIRKTSNFLLILSLITLMSWASADASSQRAIKAPYRSTAKALRLSVKIHATQEQEHELRVVCDFIQNNWDTWMNDPETTGDKNLLRLKVTDNTLITVHQAARDVLIFTKGDGNTLGAGVFKKVEKAISYVTEEEVAVAAPHSYFLNSYITERIPFGDDILSLMEHLHGSFWDLFSFYSNLFHTETRILEKVQNCRSVIQINFISYFNDRLIHQNLPVIVGKFYNGGELADLLFNNTISKEERLLICHDLLQALKDVHARNIAHNDLHSKNVLLEKDPSTMKITKALLSDFGISRIFDDQDDQDFTSSRTDDDRNLLSLLVQVFSTADPNKLTNEELVAMDFFIHASESGYSVEETYDLYIDLLSNILDSRAKMRVMTNSMQTKRVKIKQPNMIQWFPSRP